MSSKDERARKKAIEAEERRRQREIQKTEEDIEKLEERAGKIEGEMQLPDNLTDFSKLAELSSELTEIRAEIAQLYDKWESLQLC